MRRIMRTATVVVLMLALGGCLSMNPTKWWSKNSEAEHISELVDLENPISPRILWDKSVGGGTEEEGVKLVPYVNGGKVYVAERSGEIRALDASDGHTLWNIDSELNISGGPGAGDGLVLVGTSDAEVAAFDQENGKLRWRSPVSSEVVSVPKIAHNVVVVHTVDGKLTALQADSGKQLWVYERAMPVLSLRGSSSPIISDQTVFCGFANGKLMAFDLNDGKVLWEATISVPRGRSELERMVDIHGDPLELEGLVYVATFQGDVAGVVEQNGEVIWRRSLSSYAGLGGDFHQLYVTDAEDNVWAIDPRNGSALWKQDKMTGRKLSAPATVGDYVVVGDYQGYLHWLSPEDGRLVGRTRVGSDPISTPPVVVDGVAYVLGDGGDLAAVAPPKP
jgi:outer membrane protein assembly factor BamB